MVCEDTAEDLVEVREKFGSPKAPALLVEVVLRVLDLADADELLVEVADGSEDIDADDIGVDDIEIEDTESDNADVDDSEDDGGKVEDADVDDVVVAAHSGSTADSKRSSAEGAEVVSPTAKELNGAHSAALVNQPAKKNLRNIMNDRIEKRD
jgi:hypothetical protein